MLHYSELETGGATARVTLEVGSITYELDLGYDSSLMRRAKQLSGSRVVVNGTRKVCAGIDGPDQQVIRVKKIDELRS